MWSGYFSIRPDFTQFVVVQIFLAGDKYGFPVIGYQYQYFDLYYLENAPYSIVQYFYI